MFRRVAGRPVLPRMDLAAQRRRTMSRCQRRIVSGVTSSRSPWRRAFGITPSRVASSARSAQFRFGRRGCRRCRTASWWRRIKISAVFHASSRRDSRSHAAIRVIRRKTNRRHMTGDHHGRTAGRATLLVRAVDEILGTHNSNGMVRGGPVGCGGHFGRAICRGSACSTIPASPAGPGAAGAPGAGVGCVRSAPGAGEINAVLSWAILVRESAGAVEGAEGLAQVGGDGVGSGDGLPSGLDLDGAAAAGGLDEFLIDQPVRASIGLVAARAAKTMVRRATTESRLRW